MCSLAPASRGQHRPEAHLGGSFLEQQFASPFELGAPRRIDGRKPQVQARERLEDLNVTRPSLEDVYLELTEAVA